MKEQSDTKKNSEQEINWKRHLLKSGLPFEYEVKECFAKHACTVWDEYSYMKADENNIEKEFSYDLDANYWPGGHSVDFMVECKYKTEPTDWLFLPNPYAPQNDLNQNDFLHPIDYFSNNKFPFTNAPFDKVIKTPLGPFCLKGVEIHKNGSVDLSIKKAIHQLSYAFIEKVISSLESQLDSDTDIFHKTNFMNIPIIITNADLYLLNENITTKDIEASKSIKEISTKHDFLLFHNKIGSHLREYNYGKLISFFSNVTNETFKERNSSFAEDINHMIDTIASNYSPRIILIMNHDSKHENYQKLFDYINFIMKPSEERDKRIKETQKEMEERLKSFKRRVKKKE